MKRRALSLLLSPLVVPIVLVLSSGLRAHLVISAVRAVPFFYAVIAAVGFIAYFLETRPPFWVITSLGGVTSALFLQFLTRDSLEPPGGVGYLYYAAAGLLTAAVAHWIAFAGRRREKA